MTADAFLNDESARIKAALDKQRAHLLAEPFPSAQKRTDRIDRAIALLKDNTSQLCDAITADYGHRHYFQSTIADILITLDSLKYCRKHTKKWMKPEHRGAKFPLNVFGAKAYIQYQPLGVVGIMSPWNFPIQLCFSPLANALSAGNSAMIKPSEITPATSALIAALVAQYFDDTEVMVVTGTQETAAAFSNQAFDHLVFTGAPSIAKHVMRAAAENLVPLTLELGGKCPVVIGDGVDMKTAVERIMIFKTMNAGQICLAPDYVMLPRHRIDEFCTLANDFVETCYPDMAHNNDYTSIINQRQFSRLSTYLQETNSCAEQRVALGGDTDEEAMNSLRKIRPTLVINPSDDSRIMQEEIFGPLLPLKSYTNFDEVIAHINAGERPLAAYYFGKHSAEINALTFRSTSGGLCINDIAGHIMQDTMPLGGVGHSGMGAYHGIDGFRRLSHGKACYKQGLVSATGIFKPPYKDKVLNLAKKFMG